MKIFLIVLCVIVMFYIAPAVNSNDSNYYQFNIPWDDTVETSFDVRNLINDGPAGKQGLLKSKGDKVFFNSKQPVRFWGVGLTFSKNKPVLFPPDKGRAKVLARKLAKYGFNHVRFVGLDNSLPELYKTWRYTGSFDSILMDRLDYFISELRKNGIYYSFSINNTSIFLLSDIENKVRNNHKKKWRSFFIQDCTMMRRYQ